MAIEMVVPGTADLQLQHLALDVNGTLTTVGSRSLGLSLASSSCAHPSTSVCSLPTPSARLTTSPNNSATALPGHGPPGQLHLLGRQGAGLHGRTLGHPRPPPSRTLPRPGRRGPRPGALAGAGRRRRPPPAAARSGAGTARSGQVSRCVAQGPVCSRPSSPSRHVPPPNAPWQAAGWPQPGPRRRCPRATRHRAKARNHYVPIGAGRLPRRDTAHHPDRDFRPAPTAG
jgi:hypothetical protein